MDSYQLSLSGKYDLTDNIDLTGIFTYSANKHKYETDSGLGLIHDAEYKSKIMDFDAKLGYKYYFNNGYIKPYFGLGVTRINEGKIEKIGASKASKTGMNASIGILGQVIFKKFDLYGNIEYEYRFNKDSYHSKRDFSSLYEIAPLNYSRGVVNLETGINYKLNDRFKINIGYGLRETKNGMLKLGFETQF